MKTGERFGRWTVVSPEITDKKILCKCDCGEDYEVQGTLLVSSRKTDCGGAKHTKNYVYSDISG